MATYDLGFSARPWQTQVYKSLKRFSVVVVHRRGGKTVLAIMLLISRALGATTQAPRYSYCAPEKAQAKRVAFDYLVRYATRVPDTKVNQSELWVEFSNGARIQVDGADDPDRLRGIYLDGIVLDELADMKPQVWGEIVRPTLVDRKGWALFIGTPKGMNLLAELFYSASDKPDWYAARLTINDTKALDPDEVAAARREMSENQFAQEFLCDFAAGNESALLNATQVEEAAARVVPIHVIHSAPKIMGVDVARQGDDRSCIVKRQGIGMFDPIVMRVPDAMKVAGIVAHEAQEWQPDAIFVDGSGGYGAGVIDRLRQLGFNPIEVQFGGKPDDERFVNKPTEMWWRLAQWIKEGGVIPNDPALKMDLCAPCYSHANASGKLALEAKDKIKARGLPSPDCGDAAALTFSYPVATKPPEHWTDGVMANRGGLVTEYDPLAGISSG